MDMEQHIDDLSTDIAERIRHEGDLLEAIYAATDDLVFIYTTDIINIWWSDVGAWGAGSDYYYDGDISSPTDLMILDIYAYVTDRLAWTDEANEILGRACDLTGYGRDTLDDDPRTAWTELHEALNA